MRVRHLAGASKVIVADSGKWSVSDLPPRHAPIYAKTRPMRAGWRWRSLKAKAGTQNFVLTVICNPKRDNWQAILMVESEVGASVVARLEYHGSHPGLHIHGHCERGGIEVGGSGLDNLVRIPPAAQKHRRLNAWTEGTFWEAAKQFFRMGESPLPLFQ
jgi:hypothetical protein